MDTTIKLKAVEAVEELTELVKKPKRLNKAQSMRYTQRVMPKVMRSKLTKGSGTHKAVTFDEVMNELTYHKRVFVQHLGRFRKLHVREVLEECESAWVAYRSNSRDPNACTA